MKDIVTALSTGAANQVLTATTTGFAWVAPTALAPTSSFAGFVNVTAGDDVVGFTLPSTAKAAKALVRVYRDATTDLWEAVELNFVNKNGTWVVLTLGAVGDDSAVDFAVTSSGGVCQVRYAATTKAGHTAATSTISWQITQII
jgi:hypothetical protein